jgi:hypothetical protein
MGQKMKSAICLPHEFSDVFGSLTDEQAGQLIKAIFYYDITGEQTDLDDGVLQFAWNSHIKPKLDRIAENYAAKCAKNRENVAKRWATKDTTVYERIPTNTNVKEIRHKYGEYQNVLLSDTDYEKLKDEFPTDYAERIEAVSEYCKSSGKSYKDYLATIRAWARRDAKKSKPTKNDVNAGYNDALNILGLKNG